MNKFLYWLAGRLPARIISDGSVPYLERYYLFTILGWRFYLHRFVGSDPDRGLHDHPWTRAFSLVLHGWYYEERRSGRRKVLWFNSLAGDTFHRVVLPCNYATEQEWPCWTLFFHRAGSTKEWGFLNDCDGGKNKIFRHYLYTREGSQKGWWMKAPKGRDIARQPR